jgi:hypothetical protein
VLVVGCSNKVSPPPAKSGTELRVPLPEGWVATGSNDRLLAGPKGRMLVSFESKTTAAPTIEALLAALEGQKATSVQTVEGSELVAARYALEGREAFVGIKTIGDRTVWCASLPGASEAEVLSSVWVCKDIELR